MNIQNVLSTNIRTICNQRGLKQKAVAEICGIEEKAFSNMLCNRQEIRTEHIPIIAKALDVSVNELFKVDS